MKGSDLFESVTFDRPTFDAHGVQTGWSEGVYSSRAHFRYLRGSESVMAARLDGKQPVVATIRRSAVAETINSEWVMRDVRRGTTYNIRTVVPSDDRRFLEITAESGVAT
ncbi:phage head completion protein [Roseovarius indicus]|uniref:phage head completion protein n=1 Tax=Roseovarius indicus TaxID=540747 RepID=UPI000945DB4C|nr:head-tail adaptor protein [Roseovarius indicus]